MRLKLPLVGSDVVMVNSDDDTRCAYEQHGEFCF
jgi:hypothetical protein